MDIKIVITALLIIVILVFLLLFRKKVMINFKAFGAYLKLYGSNENSSSGGIRAKDLQAGKDIRAHEKGGQGIDVEKAKAKGSITLTNEAPPGDSPSPKP